MESGKSCVIMLLLYAGSVLGHVLALNHLITEWIWPLALVLAIFSALFLGSLVSVVSAPDETKWIQAFLRRESPRDGRPAAVCGTLRSASEPGPEPSPILDEPALAWELEVFTRVYSHTQKRSRKVLKYKGMARHPMVCETPTGNVRLAGFLDLAEIKAERRRAENVWPQLQELAKHPGLSPFELRWKGVTGHLEEFATPDDEYSQLRNAPEERLRPEHVVEEKVLKDGQPVCALGIWDRREASLKGLPILGVTRIRIFPGSPRRVLLRLRRKMWAGLAAMTGLFLLSHGVVYGVLVWGVEP